MDKSDARCIHPITTSQLDQLMKIKNKITCCIMANRKFDGSTSF